MGVQKTYTSDEDDFVCACGQEDFALLLTIDGKTMCENCIQELIDKQRKLLFLKGVKVKV